MDDVKICTAITGKLKLLPLLNNLDEAGMALDFSILKKKTKALLENSIISNLNDIAPFTEINPSSENIARYLFNLLSEDLKVFPCNPYPGNCLGIRNLQGLLHQNRDSMTTISFDLDGTLVTDEFSQVVWHQGIPELYAKENTCTLEEAKSTYPNEYAKIGDSALEWYDIKVLAGVFRT